MPDYPFRVFRFRVLFTDSKGDVPLCSGEFSECSGLEATMQQKEIKEGGRNYGAIQRAGQTTHATIVLKRGITKMQHLWQWFDFVTRQNAYAYRLTARVELLDAYDADPNNALPPLLQWQLTNALPVKFKIPSFTAASNEVGVEELHFVHEGMKLVPDQNG